MTLYPEKIKRKIEFIEISNRKYYDGKIVKLIFDNKKEFNLVVENIEYTEDNIILYPYNGIPIKYNIKGFKIIKNFIKEKIFFKKQ